MDEVVYFYSEIMKGQADGVKAKEKVLVSLSNLRFGSVQEIV